MSFRGSQSDSEVQRQACKRFRPHGLTCSCYARRVFEDWAESLFTNIQAAFAPMHKISKVLVEGYTCDYLRSPAMFSRSVIFNAVHPGSHPAIVPTKLPNASAHQQACAEKQIRI